MEFFRQFVTQIVASLSSHPVVTCIAIVAGGSALLLGGLHELTILAKVTTAAVRELKRECKLLGAAIREAWRELTNWDSHD